jgi:hypothetical protein
MKGITIAWREGPLRCEFRREPLGSWLFVMSGDELVAKEPAASVSVAAQRARELADSLPIASARRA